MLGGMAPLSRLKDALAQMRGPRTNDATRRGATKRGTLDPLFACGLRPGVVIDVGVHREGTPDLYAVFTDAHHVLIEPCRDFEEDITRVASAIERVDVVWAAASDTDGRGVVYLPTERGTCAAREVDLITLDTLCREGQWEPPYLLKIDVDGAEPQVVAGAQEVLRSTQCVIIEAAMREVAERCRLLDEAGFLLWDIVDPLYYEERLWQVDLVFLNKVCADDPAFTPWSRASWPLEGTWTHL